MTYLCRLDPWRRLLQPTLTRISKDKEKKPWMCSHLRRGGFAWPSRAYCCSFCRREFKSAQALGGHMNVHRRDKARLRQSPPSNPKLGSEAVPGSNDAFSSMISPSIHLSFSPPLASRGDDLKTMDVVKAMDEDTGNEVRKASKGRRLDLEVAVSVDQTHDLDLDTYRED